MREDAVLIHVLTETLIDEMIGALALSPTQMIRQVTAGAEIFGLTPRITFGDLISAENTNEGGYMLPTITQSAHSVLKAYLTSTPLHIASDSFR